MASKFFDALINNVKAFQEGGNGKDSGEATMEETFKGGAPEKLIASYDLASDATPKERKAVSERVSRAAANKLMTDLRESYSSSKSTSLEDLALKIAGAKAIGRKRVAREQINYALDGEEESGSSSLIETVGGQKRRATTLRPLIEELMRQYVVADMTRPNAPLQFQSGRFANSAIVTEVVATKSARSRDTVSVYFDYMTYPYAVFDPAVSNYRGLSSAGRNPRRIIGEAIERTLRDLIAQRYNIQIRQR